MMAINSIYHFMRADLLERTRSTRFLMILAATVLVGYLFVPPLDANYVTFVRGFYRGVYNSAWIGVLYGTVCTIFLPLFGFYLIKNAIERDERTRVGQIIATTPTSKPVYIFGKWLSNLAVLVIVLCVMTIMGGIMQFVRAEDTQLILGQLIIPIWYMSIPILAMVSAVAVVFESIPFLRKGFGNIAFYFLWAFVLGSGWLPSFFEVVEPRNDPLGITTTLADIQQSILAIDPDAELGTGGLIAPKEIFGETLFEEELKTFVWDGIDWTASMLLARLLWLGFPIAIAFAAAIPFDRFDPAKRKLGVRRRGGKIRGMSRKKGQASFDDHGILLSDATQLTPLTKKKFGWRFGGVLFAELRMLFKGRGLVWYAGLLGLFFGGFFTPLEYVLPYILPVAWIWPIFAWSSLGGREEQHFTRQMVFSAAFPLRRQVPAAWLAGVVVTFLSVGGIGLQLFLAGETWSMLAVMSGALFVPALAFALGTWSGSSRLFEIVYLLWWYLALNEALFLGLMGNTDPAVVQAGSRTYLSLTVLFLILAVVGRWRKLRE
ncbi:hypothetical protein ACFLYP_00210 [Chloroflexota bacterium]